MPRRAGFICMSVTSPEERLICVPLTITATCDRDTTALHRSPVLGHNVSVCDTVPLRSFWGEDYCVQAVGRLYPKSESSGLVTSLYALTQFNTN